MPVKSASSRLLPPSLGNVRVFIRVRPLLEGERKHCNNDCDGHLQFIDENTLQVVKNSGDPSGKQESCRWNKEKKETFQYKFDRIFPPKCTQNEVYEEVALLIRSALDGFNVSLLAYGQTKAGKTFTMEGISGNVNLQGIIPRTINELFNLINELQKKGWIYSVKTSFFEIYNERIIDLLNERTASEVSVNNLKVVTASNKNELLKLVQSALNKRAVSHKKQFLLVKIAFNTS
ncbi:carboxy-terminal kinesin 2-like [Procambarus clarkii]|uniref:carboxy-terminal kinesin 2-like n=1 Tax=Procambarus clarkii TaxID=6728 RepID=UPI0037439DE8